MALALDQRGGKVGHDGAFKADQLLFTLCSYQKHPPLSLHIMGRSLRDKPLAREHNTGVGPWALFPYYLFRTIRYGRARAGCRFAIPN
jgi:hypothetical protein